MTCRLTTPRREGPDRRILTAGHRHTDQGHADNRHSDEGQVTGFVVVMVAALLVLAGLVLDGGLALAAKVQAIDEAQEAARTGAQHLDLATYRSSGQVVLDPIGAEQATRAYLAATGNPQAATAIVQVTGDQVHVTLTRRQPTQLLGLVGVTTLRVHGSATAVAAHGVTNIEP